MSRLTTLASALVLLSACGGGSGGGGGAANPAPRTYPITISAVGLSGTGLTLQNGTSVITVTATGSTGVQLGLADGTSYDVRIKTQPTQPWQTCVLSGNTGVVNGASPQVTVTCTTNVAVGGVVTGLTGQDLVLANNGVSTLAVAADGAFSFDGPLAVARGSTYSVAVKAQPIARSQNCTVSRGAGTVTDQPVTDIAIVCVADALGALAGRIGGNGTRDGTGAEARFLAPTAVAADASGLLYVLDANRVRKITPLGVVTTLAGTRNDGDADGSGAAAHFDSPNGIAIDASGTLVVADTFNHTIRKVTPAGEVTTFVGAAGVAGSSDGFLHAATFNTPYGVATDNSGVVYVADSENHTIRKISPGGAVTTFAGVPGAAGALDGVGAAARFNRPLALCVDGTGNVYVADTSNHTIREITPAGVVTTLAGSANNSGFADGSGAAARFVFPRAITLGADGKLYVTDAINALVRTVDMNGAVTTIAGDPGVSGFADGAGSNARFTTPYGIAVAANGDVYVAELLNFTVRKVVGNVVSTFAGAAPMRGNTDGPAAVARLAAPYAVVAAPDGTLYFTQSSVVRKISPSGVVTTIAGTHGTRGSADGAGPAARFEILSAIARAADGTLYVTDTPNHTVRAITPDGVVSTLAGAPGEKGHVDGPAGDARFDEPMGVAADPMGNVFVSDRMNHVIRKIAPNGVVSTVSPNGGFSESLHGPAGLALDPSGYLYVADQDGQAIRVVAPNGIVSTLAGNPTQGFADGVGADARFHTPTAVALDAANNVYVADMGNARIRKITPGGVVTTIVGAGGFQAGVVLGQLPGSLNTPQGVAVLSESPLTLAVTDLFENVVLHAAVP